MLNEASTRKKIRRTTKLSPQTGTYVVQPHDESLPPEWERAVVLQADTNTGTWIWHKCVLGVWGDGSWKSTRLNPETLVDSLTTGGTTLKDPRQTIFENGDPLPAGWSIAFDDEGDVYFLEYEEGRTADERQQQNSTANLSFFPPPLLAFSHNSGTVTYDDPRTVCPDSQGSAAEQVAQKVLAPVQEDDDEEPDTEGAGFTLAPISSDKPFRVSATTAAALFVSTFYSSSSCVAVSAREARSRRL